MTTIAHRPTSSATLAVEVMVPCGWPEAVQAPNAAGWQKTAVTWLLDCCPDSYRQCRTLVNHPKILARFAADYVEAELLRVRKALEGDQPSLLDEQAEELALLARRKEIAVVEQTLSGKIVIRPR